MTDYEEKMLVLLAEKYRKSKKDSGTSAVLRRTQIKPSELYRDYDRNDGDLDQIEAVNQAAISCGEKGFLTFEMNGFSNEILKIYLVDGKIDQIEQYLGDVYQYEPRYAKKQYVEQIIARYGGLSPVASQECDKLRRSLEKNNIPKNYLQTEDILKALVFIENNQRPLYLREASMLIYGSSKYLEDNALTSVCRLLRGYLKRPCGEDELPDEILEEYQIVREKQKLCLKGDITVRIGGREMNLGGLEDGIEFYADELEQLEQVEVRAAELITVENRTSYLRSGKQGTSFFYLGGYATRFQRDFLKKVYEDNPGLRCLHFGDIDAGGFYIHDHLCRSTGIPFKMHRMSVKELEDPRYQTCLRRLTDNDRKRLMALAGQKPYREAAEYMLRHNVKLEQEIISLMDNA